MLFKTPRIASEYPLLHGDLREKLVQLSGQLAAWGLPEFTITDAIRTREEQAAIYLPHYRAKGFSETEALQLGRNKPSWHLPGFAADFRGSTRHYTREENARIRSWLEEHCPRKEWEVLLHNLGTGMHWHLGRRDFVGLRAWEQKEKAAHG